MPKPPAFAPKPPLDKLPLAVRKDIRDNFESKKEDFEKQLSDLLGVPFKIAFNPNQVWAYATDNSGGAGGILSGYAEGFIYAVKKFVEEYGDEGKDFFNAAVPQSEVVLDAHPLGDKGETISADVKDGVYRILFRHTSLGYNVNWQDSYVVPAIENAPYEGFSIRAKHSISEHWEPEYEEIQTEIGELIGIPDVKLDPNFEEVYQALLKGKKDDKDWMTSFARVILEYYKDGLKYQLNRQGFKGDEMLQEGIAEALPSKTFKMRIVDKLVKGYRNEVVFEDGVAYLQTTPDKWYYNTSEMGEGLVDLL